MSRFASLICVVCLLMTVESARVAADENWPHWRGPFGTGVGPSGAYPVKFSHEDGVTWKVKVPGRGMSTPAVWNDRIFLTAGIDGQDTALAFDLQGKELWRRVLSREREGKHRNASGSNPSPATDGKHLVVYFKSGTLACLDRDGAVLWQHNLQNDFAKDTLWWDLATSPVLAGDNAVVAVMQEGDSYLAAFDLNSGKLAWKQKRQYDRPQESDQSYSTPQLVELGGRQVLVTWGADHLTGHAADTGELLWEFDGFNPNNEEMWRVIASAPVDDGYALVPWGRGKFLTAWKLPEGKVASTQGLEPAWEKTDVGADVPTPALANGLAYVLQDDGKILCLDLKSGEQKWSSQLPKNRNRFYASPVTAGNKLYCFREDGAAFVGRVDDAGFELLAENDMGERVIATPVPVRDGLLVRGEDHLFRIENVEATASNAAAPPRK